MSDVEVMQAKVGMGFIGHLKKNDKKEECHFWLKRLAWRLRQNTEHVVINFLMSFLAPWEASSCFSAISLIWSLFVGHTGDFIGTDLEIFIGLVMLICFSASGILFTFSELQNYDLPVRLVRHNKPRWSSVQLSWPKLTWALLRFFYGSVHHCTI